MPPSVLDYAPRTEFDTGLFVSRYLRVLGWLSIISMILSPIFFKTLRIDFSFIFLFWAASALKRRSQTARKWVIGIAGLMLCMILLMFVWAAVAGTDGMKVTFWTSSINDPELWQVLAVMVPLAVVVSIPLAILLSDRSRRQFNKN